MIYSDQYEIENSRHAELCDERTKYVRLKKDTNTLNSEMGNIVPGDPIKLCCMNVLWKW